MAMLRVCLLSKYPPIEGGVASTAYWLAKELGNRGHQIHVVTNAIEVEESFREHLSAEDLVSYQPKNVFIHNTNPFEVPRHIPYSKAYAERLASYAIDVIRHYDLQVIDSWYLLPYAVAGYLASCFTKRPWTLRHAGSDIARLFSSNYLRTILLEVVKSADKVVTSPSMKPRLMRAGITEAHLSANIRVSVDTRAFNPAVKPFGLESLAGNVGGLPVLGYIGKIGVVKGVFELIEALGGIAEDFVFLVVAGGQDQQRLLQSLTYHNIAHKTLLLDFVPPWRVPSIMRACTCVVHPERDFPIEVHTPILPREVMATGTCLLLSEELYSKRPSHSIIAGESVLTADPRDIDGFRRALRQVIRNPDSAMKIGETARQVSEHIENFRGYVDSVEALYSDLIGVV